MNSKLELNFIKELEINQRLIHKVCRIYTKDMNEHDDLFQEICIQLWHAYKSFEGRSKFSTWAYRVCLNTAISLHRKKNVKIVTTNIDKSISQFRYDDYSEDDEMRLKKMYEAIHKLNDIDKAFVLLYLEDKTYSEIAETLGINEGNVRVKLNRIKTKLTKLISE